ncbi:Lon protease C-terminal proteolytic domain-containing protein [Obelidium mucronatum]|nr:Lon protease C-terminal proteolytic domain-containing protein [Obelidium mucronatum]
MQVQVAAGSRAAALMEQIGRQLAGGQGQHGQQGLGLGHPLVACVPLKREKAEKAGNAEKAEHDDLPPTPPRCLASASARASPPSAASAPRTQRRAGRRRRLCRVRINNVKKADPFLVASVSVFEDAETESPELIALSMTLKAAGNELTDLLAQLSLPAQTLRQLKKTIDEAPATKLADLLASMIDLSHEEKLELLSMVEDRVARVARVAELVTRQVQVLKISQKIQTTVENKLGKQQREFILRQQNSEKLQKALVIQIPDPDLTTLKTKLETSSLPEEASKATRRELSRMARMPSSMPEHQIIRSYLEWMSEMPWNIGSGSRVKKRVLEFLAVGKLKKDLKGPILCLLGPPGVGKTSLGKSIATALGRKFHRISLGGVRDEAEIRGHRRTYVGALPGLIIQGMKKCGVNDPIFLLDEIDKLTRDARGDPSAALLEVLDPEQNSTFTDHYLNVPFDLSKVLFIATANDAETISAPLMDRMEVINIPGYTFPEKLQIASSHLLPKQLKIHGLNTKQITLPDASLLKIATEYTRESGVRTLDRELASICRYLAVTYAQAQERHVLDSFSGFVSPAKVEEILGAPKYVDEVSERGMGVGVVTGLAWTASGSGGLLFIEAIKIPTNGGGGGGAKGGGGIVLTGKLGDVIKESAQIGVSWVRANSGRLGLCEVGKDLMNGFDVHVHFPAGATPKDGPSAGIAIVTALVSLFSGRPVRNHVAMTGEMTLRGQVHPVGGIKEKLLAAHRGGIKRVILPERNRKDIDEIPRDVQNSMQICFVERIDEVLELAFEDGKSVFLGRDEGPPKVTFEAKL